MLYLKQSNLGVSKRGKKAYLPTDPIFFGHVIGNTGFLGGFFSLISVIFQTLIHSHLDNIFLHFSMKTFVVGNYNICFQWEMRKKYKMIIRNPSLSFLLALQACCFFMRGKGNVTLWLHFLGIFTYIFVIYTGIQMSQNRMSSTIQDQTA